MKQFASVSKLIDELREEARGTTRFPARFILTEKITDWKELISSLEAEVARIICLSKSCAGEDSFPYVFDLTDQLEKDSDDAILLLPLMECVRFSNDNAAGDVLRKLATWENVSTKRVYVPLFAATEILESSMSGISRYKSGELPEVWGIPGQDENIRLTIVPFKMHTQHERICVEGVKNYLRLWEHGGPSTPDMCLVTKLAPFLSACLGVVEVMVCKDGFEMITQNVRGAHALCNEWGNEYQWRWLAERIHYGDDFQSLMGRILNVGQFNVSQLFSGWKELDPKRRWLSWLWSKLEKPGKYVSWVLNSVNACEAFEDAIINGVFDASFKTDIELLKERRQIISDIGINDMPGSFWQDWKKLKGPLLKLEVLTGLTQREREEAVLAVKQLIEQNNSLESFFPYLEVAYPQLALYLAPFRHDEALITEYFHLYTISKVLDSPFGELSKKAEQAARSQEGWKFQPRDSILESISQDSTSVLWIDGMGLEWVSFILGYLERQQVLDVEFSIARANLPTTTEANKGWSDNAQVIRNLDELAHKPYYQFPGSLVKELDIIEKAVQKAIQHLEYSPEVILTSDHGLTRYLFNKNSIKPPKQTEVHKWGRCGFFERQTEEISEGSHWIIESNRICLAIHGRFEGGSGAVGEVHGGATLEEWLVPVVKLRKKAPSFEELISYSIRLESSKIRLDTKGRGYLHVEVSPDVEELSLRVSDKIFKAIRKGPEKFRIDITSLSAGQAKGLLESRYRSIGEVTFEVIRGIEEEDLGL